MTSQFNLIVEDIVKSECNLSSEGTGASVTFKRVCDDTIILLGE